MRGHRRQRRPAARRRHRISVGPYVMISYGRAESLLKAIFFLIQLHWGTKNAKNLGAEFFGPPNPFFGAPDPLNTQKIEFIRSLCVIHHFFRLNEKNKMVK